MKRLILIIVAICSGHFSIAQSWFVQNSGTDSTLDDVYFVNNDIGYACGWNTVLKTTDGGTNWLPLTTGFANYYLNVRFINADTGFVSGFVSGVILKTTDGGSTWSNIGPNITDKKTYGTWFLSADTGLIAMGDYNPPIYPTMCNSKILKTHNGGATWDTVYSSALWISYFSFPTHSVGYATRNDGHVLKTTDGGDTWSVLDSLTHFWMSGVSFLNSDTGFVGAGGCNSGAALGEIWKTTDAGTNWLPVFSSVSSDSINGGYRLFLVNANTTYNLGGSYDCTGVGGKLFKSTDGGSNWNKEITPRDSIMSMYFTSETNGYAVGSNGGIIKYGYPPSEVNSLIGSQFGFAYPNPATSVLNITAAATDLAATTVVVYSMVGTEFDVKCTFTTANKILLDIGDLPSGLYFYKIRNSSNTATHRFIKQ